MRKTHPREVTGLARGTGGWREGWYLELCVFSDSQFQALCSNSDTQYVKLLSGLAPRQALFPCAPCTLTTPPTPTPHTRVSVLLPTGWLRQREPWLYFSLTLTRLVPAQHQPEGGNLVQTPVSDFSKLLVKNKKEKTRSWALPPTQTGNNAVLRTSPNLGQVFVAVGELDRCLVACLPRIYSSTNLMGPVLESDPLNESLIFRTLMYDLKMETILVPRKHPGPKQSGLPVQQG